MTTVAFLGTGLVGSAMAERALGLGVKATVWNRTISKARALERFGARVAETAADAVSDAHRVHIVLSDDAAVDAVLGAITKSLRPGTIVIDHSTTSPAGTVQRFEEAKRAGVRFLHAPVFMSPQMAREGVGLMMVSGLTATYEQVRQALTRMSGEIWHVGERPDLAASYKLFGNAMIFAINAGLADVFAMANSLDIAPLDAIGVFSKFNFGLAIPMRAEKMARRDFNAMFELTMAAKDARLMIDAAGSQPLVVLPSVRTRMEQAIAEGHGQHDLVSIAARVVPDSSL